MAETTNYQCPHCMGPLHFSSRSGKLECDYCGSSFTPEELSAVDQKATAAQDDPERSREDAEAWGQDADKMRSYSCTTCGAQLICEESTAATACPYCGNPTILPGQFHGMLKPDYVIPFRLSKERAVEELKRHYRKKLLLPRVFAEENHIQKIQGIYVPFWLFDLRAEGSVTYSASRSSTHREGNYRVTNTKHYKINRAGSIFFKRVPVDGSKKMPDALMDSLEPYNYQELTEFSTAYLPGFLADKYDVDASASYNRALNRCKTSTQASFRETVTGYENVRISHDGLKLKQEKMSYALLPVWLLTTKWKDNTYLFAMNGQTGKMVGNLPVDQKKKALLFLGTFITSSALTSFFLAGWLGQLVQGFFRILFS